MKKSKLLLKLFSSTTTLFYGINKYIELRSENKSKKIKGNFYQWKYGNLFYNKTGNGTPLLLIHDLNISSSTYEWTHVIEKLSNYHTVYTIDLIGCGRSNKPALLYTNYFYVNMINNFISDVIGKKVDVVATGDSCTFVLMANSIKSNLINHIYLINPKSINHYKKTPGYDSKKIKNLFHIPIIGKTVYYLMQFAASSGRKCVLERPLCGA